MAEAWMTAQQAADRLGVKVPSLYAYVSRGALRSERVAGTRQSRYLRVDVERLAARQRAGGRAGALDIVLETELTLLDPAGTLAYRGWRVEDAVRDASFEEVASWLWTRERTAVAIEPVQAMVTAARRAVRSIPRAPLIDHVRLATAAMRVHDPLRDDRRPNAVATTGRAIIGTLLHSIAGGTPEAPTASVARRLWPLLTDAEPAARAVRHLDAALVLLADHELAASTLAARVAASTWADPYLVVQAGLAALGGPLHGGASENARETLREVRDGGATAEEVIGAQLRSGQRIAGFGHSVYATGDPRARILLGLLPERSTTASAARRLLAATRDRDLPPANVDFALAVLAETYRMRPHATEVVFALARIVGWLGHAIEEYGHRLRFRPRAVYTGPPVG